MKKIATVTFHGAHNYGSVLQAYALQTFIENICAENNEEFEYKIINYRSILQKNIYGLIPKFRSPKDIIKIALRFVFLKKYKSKYAKFEDFIKNDLNTTTEINSTDILQSLTDFDYYISGSDQIWNVRSKDFEDLYYLDFVNNAKKISYAASCGPLMIEWNLYNKEKYASLISKYNALSVREDNTKVMIDEISGKSCDIHVDPTLLLTKQQWRELQTDSNYNEGKYILLYALEPSKKQLSIVDAISKKLNLPVVITKYNNKNDFVNHFLKMYDCGPKDFLSYIDHATLVLSSSFHGTAFSIIYGKKFYSLNGSTDNRISSILSKCNLMDRSVDSMSDVDKVNLNDIDYSYTKIFLENERHRSYDYLKQALDI